MHSKDKLADELMKAGLVDMAAKAREGYYHDFLSPLDSPCLQLAADLAAIETAAAADLYTRHLNGEFDATVEEGDEWAASPEGQEAFRRLVESMKNAVR